MDKYNTENDTLKEFKELDEYKSHQLTSEITKRFAIFLSKNQKERSQKCGTFLAFKKYINTQNHDIKRVLSGANFCKARFCAMCQWRKSEKMTLEVMSKIEQARKAKNLSALMLTLTVPNPPINQLHDTVLEMSKAWFKFIRRKEVSKVMQGFVRGIEFLGDHTPMGEAHPHYHVLVLVDQWYFKSKDYLNQEKWRALWESCYGVPNLQVHVEKVKPKQNTTLDPILSACYEVCKYTAKATDVNRLPDDDLKALLKQTRGLRSYALGGCLKEYEAIIEELDPTVWQFIEEEFYSWTHGNYKKIEQSMNIETAL